MVRNSLTITTFDSIKLKYIAKQERFSQYIQVVHALRLQVVWHE